MTVSQEEMQERQNQALCLDMEGRPSGTADRPQYGARRKASARMPAQHAASCQSQRQNSKGSNKNVGSRNELKCYEFGGIWHYARECLSRRNRSNPRNPQKNRKGDAPQGSTMLHSRDSTRGPKGRKKDQPLENE